MAKAPKKKGDEEGAIPGLPVAFPIGGLLLATLGGSLLLYDVWNGEEHAIAWLPLVVGSLALCVSGIWHAAGVGAEEQRRRADGPRRVQTHRTSTRPASEAGGFPLFKQWPRERIGALVIFALLVQAAIPLTYYFGNDPYDERFSWRMFSAVRVNRCELRAYEDHGAGESPVNLGEEIHVAWANLLRRNRAAAMEGYLHFRCEQESLQSARLRNRCSTPEGETFVVEPSIECESLQVVGLPGDGEQ